MTWWLALIIGGVLGGAFGLLTMCVLAMSSKFGKSEEKRYKKG